MMQLISVEHFGTFTDEIEQMHRLRYRVFKERLDWDVHVSGDMEIDEFDALGPVYLVQRSPQHYIQGCVRLLPTTGPTMMRNTFPVLLGEAEVPNDPVIWESSRFALDNPINSGPGNRGVSAATYELFAGMIEFGLSRGLSSIVTVTDARMERILQRAGWSLRRLSKPHPIGRTLAVAGLLEVSGLALNRIRAAGDIVGPVLWTPALTAAA